MFNIILHWIDHNKSERKKYFANFFRHVGLIYVSRDYLLNDIVTNDLVNDNACCLELVKAAMKVIDSKNSENVSFPPPRKSLETPFIVVGMRTFHFCVMFPVQIRGTRICVFPIIHDYDCYKFHFS